MNETFSTVKMTEQDILFDPDNEVDQLHGYYMFISSIIFFGILNVVVTIIGKPKSVKSDSWRWNNLVISWVHGFICGLWDVLCLVLYPELFDDLVHHINYFTYLMVAFSTGYFVYDLLDLIVKGKVLGNWEVTLHHIAVISMFWYNFHCKMCIGYNVLALMAEINSFFLHSRKLLHMLNYEFDNMFYKTVCIVNLLTFFFCRGFSLCRISYGMYVENHRVPKIYFRCLCASIFVMNVINPILFWRLFKNDILRNILRKPSKPQSLVNGNNNQSKAHLKSN